MLKLFIKCVYSGLYVQLRRGERVESIYRFLFYSQRPSVVAWKATVTRSQRTNDDGTSKLYVFMNSCMQKTGDDTFLSMCYTVMQQKFKKKKSVLEEAHISWNLLYESCWVRVGTVYD